MKLRRAPILYLRVADSTVHAEATRAGALIWAGDARYAGAKDLAEVVAQLAVAAPERCRRLHVRLERPPAQTRTLTGLPPVREAELAALVANQTGRFFRRNGAPLVTDAVWVRDGNGQVTQAAAAEEPLLVAIVEGATQAGLIVESIGPAGLSPQLQLLPAAERAVRLRARRRAVIRLGAAACVVWLTVGALFGIRLISERHDVDVELAAADVPMAALRDVRREMRAAETMVITLAEARRSRGQALATLARMRAAIPDSAVLTTYRWSSDGSGLVAGAGRRAADVLAAVERSRAVMNPRIEGAIVREAIAGRDWERFTIVFGPSNP